MISIRMTAAMFVMMASVMACATEADEEEVGTSEEKLDIGCLQNARSRADVEACLGGSFTPPPPPPNAGGGGGQQGQSCSTSIVCQNGECKCGSGAKQGTVCDLASCQTVCRECK